MSEDERRSPPVRYETSALPERLQRLYAQLPEGDDGKDLTADIRLLRAVLWNAIREYDEDLEALRAFYAAWREEHGTGRSAPAPPNLKLTPPENLTKAFRDLGSIIQVQMHHENDRAIQPSRWHDLVSHMKQTMYEELTEDGEASAEEIQRRTQLCDQVLRRWQARFDEEDLL